MSNIPIYRAKKINSDEYVEGYFAKDYYEVSTLTRFSNIIFTDSVCFEEIDPATLAINFPDMLDSQGNKIFASLQEDGKGGDIMQDDEYIGIAKYIDCQFVVGYENCIDNIDNGNFYIIGIQE